MINKTRPFLFLILATAQFLFCASSQAATIVWTNTTGGSWSVAANWKPNQVPGASDNARITNSGTYEVDMDVAATVNSLMLGGLSGQQTLNTSGQTLVLNTASALNANGIFALSGDGYVNSLGLLKVGGQFQWSGGYAAGAFLVQTNALLTFTGASGSDYSLQGVLTNSGIVRLVTGNLDFDGSTGTGELVNLPGGLVDIRGDVNIDVSSGGFGLLNRGTLRKSAGSGVTTINSAFYNPGTLDVLTGSVVVAGGGDGGGQFVSESSATLNFADSYTLDDGSMVSGAGTNILSAGAITVNSGATFANTVMTGGTLQSINGTINGNLTWLGGDWNGAVLTIASNAVLTLAGNAVVAATGNIDHDLSQTTLTNYGTVLWTGGRVRGGGASGPTLVYNYGTWNAQCDQVINADYEVNAGFAFYNFGSFLKSAGSGSPGTAFLAGVNFDNTGTLDVRVGLVTLGVGEGSGQFTTEAGTTLGFANDYIVDAAAILDGTGTNLISGGDLTLNSGFAATNIVMTGGNLLGTNGTINGNFTWLGGTWNGAVITIASNSVVTITSDLDHDLGDTTLTNYGTVLWTGGRMRGGGTYGPTLAYNYGTWNAQCDQVFNDDLAVNAGTVFYNFGSFIKSAGSNSPGTVFLTGVIFDNFGVVDARVGGVSIAGTGEGSGQFIAEAGATVNFASSYDIDGGATFSGAGTNVLSAGTLMSTNGIINGNLMWLGGDFDGAILTLASNAVLTLAGGLDHDLGDTTLTNYGTVLWTGGRVRGGGTYGPTLIYNYGTWNAQCDQVFNDNLGVNVGTVFYNFGSFLKSSGSDSPGTAFLAGVDFNNPGILDVRAGAVTIAGTGEGTGQFIAEAGTTVDFASNYNLDSGATFSGAGTNVLSAGTLESTNGTINGNFTWLGGNWDGAVLTIASNAVLTIAGDLDHDLGDATLTNYGTVLWTGGRVRGGGTYGPTLVYNYGTWNAQCDQVFNDDLAINAGTIFYNFGSVLKSAGTNSTGTGFLAGVDFNNAGLLDVQTGLVGLEGTYSLTGGSLNFGLGGATNYGQLNLSGNPAALDGTIGANFNNGYLPLVGESFAVVTYASAGGSFTNNTLPYFVQWQTNYTPTSFDLTVVEITAVLVWTNPAAISYGTALGSNQLDAAQVVPGTVTYIPPTGTILDAGNYSLSAVFIPTDTTTYHSITSQVSIAVSPVPLAITADSFTRTYGQANPAFTGSIVGLVNGDIITAAFTCTATLTTPPGVYPITASLIDPNSRAGNYKITSTPGTLTIIPGPAPEISGISTNAGPTTGGTTITLSGANFESGATVTFGSATPVPAVVLSPASATVVSPPSPAGAVTVTLNNPDGASASASQLFTYGVAPSIQTGPLSQSVVVGTNAQFKVVATGGSTLAYQWMFAGATLPESGHAVGTQTATLTLNNVSTTDIGLYQVFISNPYGQAASSGATLNLLFPPTITAQPQSQSVGVGAAVTFAVAADGTAPLAYQWRYNNTVLAGATNALLSIANAQTANAGNYTVVITNIAGSVTSAPASLTLLDYCASAQVASPSYPMNTPVPINVRTINCGTAAPVPTLTVAVWVFNSGASQTVTATTDGSGNAVAIFTPLPGEVGVCQFGVALPGQGAPAPSGSFTLIGMAVEPATITPRLVVGVPQTITVNLTNLTLVGLSGIQASVLGQPANVGVHFLNVPPVLSGGNVAPVSFTISNTDISIAQQQFSLQFASAEGVTTLLTVNATMTSLSPLLAATPENLTGTMIDGGQSLVSFTLTNQGAADSGPLQIQLPAAPWLSLVTTQLIASLPPGQSSQVTLALTPAANLPLGPYTGTIEVTGTNMQLAMPFNFDCVSSVKGALQVSVEDELTIFGSGVPNVSNAVVTLTDFQTGTNVASAITGPSGTVLFTNLTSAYYTVAVQAPDHGNFSSSLLVKPNVTNDVTAFLSLQLVSYVWTVLPTQIPDQYDFVLTTVFQTEVPWPVVSVSPGNINLCDLPGNTNQIDLVITNSGLIAAENLQLVFGTNADWSIKPLIGNLGDLAGNSAVSVPVLITRLGSDSTVASSIAAQVNWSVTTPTQGTIYNATPIFVYNANPDSCHSTPVVVLSGGGGGGGGGGGFIGGGGVGGVGGGSGSFSPSQPVVSQPSYTLQTNSGAIVDVTLQIDQTAVISRNAFKATLQLNNGAGAEITDLSVTINPVDANNNPAPAAFFIQPPALNDLNAVDGTGSMADGASGTVSWTIIPTTNAAPNGTTIYGIGGTLAYKLGGEQVTIPLFAVPITVLPDPRLSVDYFLQHDVYSDDPFTPQIEPSIPFGLGIMMRNTGLGTANAVTITSAQPTIIANSNGLIISFELIGSQAGTNQSVSPSLTLDLGDIGPNTNSVGVWLMTSTLEGAFVNYSATFQHTDALGGTNTSLVDSVRIHEMNHIVRITTPVDDGIPDFLVNDTTNVDALPGNVYSSDGAVYPVTSVTNGFTTGIPTVTAPTITLTLPTSPAGFAYVEVADPGAGAFLISSVRRSDGTDLLIGPDVWQTPERIHMLPPQTRNLIHLFDHASTGSYTITFTPLPGVPAVTILVATADTASSATLNTQVDPNGEITTVYFQWGATTNYGNVTPSVVLTTGLNSLQTVPQTITGLLPGTTIHFQAVAANNLGTIYGSDQVFNVSPQPPAVTTIPASAITRTNATLNALVTPDGALTSVYFQWGATTNYGNVTITNALSANLNTPQTVATAIAGYPAGTTNHFRAIAFNAFGLVPGADMIIGPLPTVAVRTNSSSQVVVSWPTNYPGFTAQSTTNLSPPVVWSPLLITPFVSGGNFVITNQISHSRMFFRLQQ